MLILIVDSSIQIIERLEEIISDTKNITAVHKAISYKEAKTLFKEIKPDTVLLDIDLPENESLKLVKEIKNAGRKTRVIILFSHIDNYRLEQFKSLGIDLFFDKYYEFDKIGRLLTESHFWMPKKALTRVKAGK